jgi:hypothetical protein
MLNPSTLKVGAGVSAEYSVVTVYKIARDHIPQERNVTNQRHEKKKYS